MDSRAISRAEPRAPFEKHMFLEYSNAWLSGIKNEALAVCLLPGLLERSQKIRFSTEECVLINH